MKANVFKVKLIKCPLNIPVNCTETQSLEAKIFPFHRFNYILNFYGSLIKSNINCTCKALFKIPNKNYIII